MIRLSRQNNDPQGHRCHSDLSNATCLNNSQSIIEATVAGKACVKRVNVHHIVYKSEDLKLCLQQQDNALGFLPINNLSYRSRIYHLPPKSSFLTPNLTLSKFIVWLEIEESIILKRQESCFPQK